LAASSSLSPGGAWSPSPPCGGGSAGALERRGAVGSGLAAAASRHYSVIPNGGCARPTRAGSSSTPARRRPGGSQGSPRGPLHVHRLRLRVISGCPVGEFHCDQWLACRLVVMRHAMQPPSNGVPSGPRPPALSRVTRVPVGRDRWLWLRRCPPRTVPLPFEAQVPHDLSECDLGGLDAQSGPATPSVEGKARTAGGEGASRARVGPCRIGHSDRPTRWRGASRMRRSGMGGVHTGSTDGPHYRIRGLDGPGPGRPRP